jgi:thymidine phosphorylase
VRLSPADDRLIRVERPLDFDSEGQLVASVMSKKIAAGSSHIVIDMPVGPTAKVRSAQAAESLRQRLEAVGAALGVHVEVVNRPTPTSLLSAAAEPPTGVARTVAGLK